MLPWLLLRLLIHNAPGRTNPPGNFSLFVAPFRGFPFCPMPIDEPIPADLNRAAQLLQSAPSGGGRPHLSEMGQGPS
jgi:hypothetical protein